MTRQDVLNNIRTNYGQYDIDMEAIEENIRSGEAQGFSYQTIYTGLRMALSTAFGVHELFTPAELAEALGTTETEIAKEVEAMREAVAAAGGDPDEYAYKVEPEGVKRFILPAGFLG